MKPITIRISANRLEEIEKEAEEREMSKSEIIRERLDELDDAEQLRSELEANLDELKTENERLRREKRQILEQREENTELVLFAETERERRERERERRQHNVFRRAWWWVAGEPD